MTIGIWISVFLVGLAGVVTSHRFVRKRDRRRQQIDTMSRVVQTPMGPVQYRQVGAPAGQTLLYLHGTPGGCDQAPQPRDGFQTVAPSRPGYLATPLSTGASPAEQADACAALLDTLGIPSAVVMGVSGGGPAALAFAERHPERTRALILWVAVSESIRLPEPKGPQSSDFFYQLGLGMMQKRHGDEGLVRRFIPNPDNQDRLLAQPEPLRRFVETLWSIWPPSDRRAGWDNDRTQYRSLRPDYARITCPTLVLHGSDDEAVPVRHSRSLARRLPFAELHVLDGADHFMAFTHAEECRALTDAFLTRHMIGSELTSVDSTLAPVEAHGHGAEDGG